MAFLGIFNNYSKPGPGVEKDEPEKSPFEKYFILLGRRLSKLMQANLILMIPGAVAIVLMLLLFISPIQRYGLMFGNTGSGLNLWNLYVVPIPLILWVPFFSGLTYVTRKFAIEEYVFLWSDFWDGVKKNWKPFLINGIICYVAYVALSFSLYFYSTQLNSNWLMYIPFIILIFVAIMFIVAEFYVPLLIVSTDIKLKYIFKNAFIFNILGIGRNFLFVLILALVLVLHLLVLPIYYITLILDGVLVIIFTLSFVSYSDSFIFYPLIKKYVLDPYLEQQKKDKIESGEEVPTEDSIEAPQEDEEEKQPEYIFVNGKMVKREDLDK
jgi:uncharacterized membrane protein YesL